MSGALAVHYRSDDLLLAVVRVLDAIGETNRAEQIRREFQQ